MIIGLHFIILKIKILSFFIIIGELFALSIIYNYRFNYDVLLDITITLPAILIASNISWVTIVALFFYNFINIIKYCKSRLISKTDNIPSNRRISVLVANTQIKVTLEFNKVNN